MTKHIDDREALQPSGGERYEGTAQLAAVLEENTHYIWEHHIRPLITPSLIQEHAEDPLGRHTPALDMLLSFLRSDPMRGKPQYVIMCTVPATEWVIGEHPRRRGEIILSAVDSERYASVDAAEHAIFLRRLRDLGVDV